MGVSGQTDLPARQQPSCRLLPPHKSHRSGFRRLSGQEEKAPATSRRSPRRWQRLVRMVLPRHGTRAGGAPKRQVTFSYDVESYRKNFDDGGEGSCSPGAEASQYSYSCCSDRR